VLDNTYNLLIFLVTEARQEATQYWPEYDVFSGEISGLSLLFGSRTSKRDHIQQFANEVVKYLQENGIHGIRCETSDLTM